MPGTPTAQIATGKAMRKLFALLYNGTSLEIIGKGIEEMTLAQNANVETVSDVLGYTETSIDKYEKSTELDPIYVEGGNEFSEFLDKIEEENLTLTSLEKEFVWVKLYKTHATSTSEAPCYVAWKQKAVVELTSFGGDTKGVNAPCTLHWIGARTMGKVVVTESSGVKSYTFTADA